MCNSTLIKPNQPHWGLWEKSRQKEECYGREEGDEGKQVDGDHQRGNQTIPERNNISIIIIKRKAGKIINEASEYLSVLFGYHHPRTDKYPLFALRVLRLPRDPLRRIREIWGGTISPLQ